MKQAPARAINAPKNARQLELRIFWGNSVDRAEKRGLILSQSRCDWLHGPPARWILLFQPPAHGLLLGRVGARLWPTERRASGKSTGRRQFNGQRFVQLRELIDSGLDGMNFPPSVPTYHRPYVGCSSPER
jgi:hypothetical protein